MQYFTQKDGALVFRRRQELLEIRPWGEGLRVRATQNRTFTDRDWALSISAPENWKCAQRRGIFSPDKAI